MKNKRKPEIKKLSLSKEKVAVLNNLMLNKIIGGDAVPPVISFTHTAPSGANCG